MSKKQKTRFLVIWVCALIAFLAASLLVGSPGRHESIKVTMKDAVLHEVNRISLFGLIDVNPGLISAYTITACLLVIAALIRVLVIPKFTLIPGKFQLFLEEIVGMFDGLAKSNSPHKNKALGAYVFAAGVYIFISTLFELFGLQGITTEGASISLPAPLSDINGAIAMGCMSYLFILSGGVTSNGITGVGRTLKEFSLPISMSFRLFGAMLSGLLVTELVYYYTMLSFVLPVAVGVMFTLLHALIQAYVLTMLTALFYGEVSEPAEPKQKKEII